MPFSKAFDYASGVTADRFTNPLWRVTDFLNGSKFRPCLREIKAFGLSVVAAAQQKRSKSESSSDQPLHQSALPLRVNLIDSLLDHIYSPQTVADSAINFLSAGRDTTAQSLTWTIYYLLRNPSILAALRESLHETFPSYTRRDALPLSYAAVSAPHALSYAQAIFAESIRLTPAVPFELKESTAESTLPDGTYLPKGSVVLWIPYSLARSPEIWGPDAAIFLPERWIEEQGDGSKKVITRSAFENPVFNAGPRMCIGKKMAEILAVRVFIELLWRWDIEEVRGKGEVGGERVIAESLTSPMEGGLPVRVSRARLDKIATD